MVAEDEPLVVTLEEAPSASTCLRALDRSTAQRSKAVTSAKEAKRWADYQRTKRMKREALNGLIAALADPLGDGQTDAPTQKQTKDNKANSSKDKARRRSRTAAAAARCFLHDEDEDVTPALECSAKDEAEPCPAREQCGEVALLVGASAANDKVVTEVKLPGAWQTVVKRGKVLSDFPPLKPSNKDDARATLSTKKRVSSPKIAMGSPEHDESPAKSVKRE